MTDIRPVSSTSATGLPPRALRVFIVEDSAAILEYLIESISALDHVHVVGHADTERDAIIGLQETPCDAVVLDLQLRTGHGFNVLKSLRDSPPEQRVIVLVLTNHATPQYRARSMQLGADYFFDKSREDEQLCEVLQGLVHGLDLGP